jgi:hypothetical protein
MGDARNALDAVTVAPIGFGDWAGIVSDQSDAVVAESAFEHGAAGDDTTDDTAELQAAINAAGRDRRVVLEKAIYRITAALEIPFAGLTIEGANSAFTRIRQVTANENCIELIPDTTYDFTNAIGVTLRGLRLSGPGGATTGMGVWSDPAVGTYQGAKLTLDDVRVDGFDVGVRLNRFDNTFVHDLHIQSCRLGWWSSGNANTIHIVNGSCSTISECGWTFADGAGVTFHPGDLINSAKMIRVTNGAQVTIIGGNFESCSGTEGHIDIEDGGRVIAWGQKFLKGTVETPGFRVGLANLIEGGGIMSNFTTAPLVKKINDTGVTFLFPAHTSLSGTERNLQMSDAALATLAHSLFPNRIDNSVPAAAVQYRGLVLHKVVRDSVSAEDALYWYGKDRSGGSDVYTQRVMTNVIEGTGTPEGAVTARVGTYFARRDGAAGTALYVKESGTGNTGWAPVGFQVRAVQATEPSTTGWAANQFWYDTSTE